ncbi:serine/threonine-protein kinase [Leptolyngbya sp. FACHB-261]|uniref:serine/threonine protein kinase n=1 Tax=Leptolyngbya sp. FACHB-261 TaxID=2692806 RepID=UPI0016869A0D|nr:serine/threonine-protein kinase [Leptolyngbya sp. FACHB-261]MBD2102775.1 serine/threonine protein kinase [Leptolyngbya sp. FACHB-261]
MLESGQVLRGRYRLKALLGQNAGRQTWLAEDQLAQPVAQVVVKLLAFGAQMQWDNLKLFEREAQVLRRLNHPQIPKYRDYFSLGEQPGDALWFGLVQEHIPGQSLKQLLEQGQRLSEVQVRNLAKLVLNVLIYLHELNPPVIHRDIKPSNLILGQDGQLYLVDFGAVQDRAAAEGATFTVVGTYGYVPPEQFGGRAVPASDLYALGATLIHLLTGTAPADLPQHNLRIQFAEQASASPALVRWIRGLTEPALERRFNTALQAREALNSGGDLSKPTEKVRQPAGSRVWFRKSSSQLRISIPRQGLHLSDTFPVLFSAVWLGLVPTFVHLTGILLTGAWPLSLLFIPYWLIGPRMMAAVLLPAFGRTHVYFDSDRFEIEWRLFGIWYRQRGQTTDVNKVSQETLMPLGFINPRIRNQRVPSDSKIPFLDHEVVTLEAGIKRYSFGAGLTAVERDWLSQEIYDWLGLQAV